MDAARTGKLCRGRGRIGGVRERGLMALLIAHSVEFSPIAVRRIVRNKPKDFVVYSFFMQIGPSGGFGCLIIVERFIPDHVAVMSKSPPL